MRSLRALLLGLVVLGLIPAASASAQCMPDNLAGQCCQPTQARLPQFPGIRQEIRFLCFDACQPRIDARVCVDIGPPRQVLVNNQPVCGVYLIPFTIQTCGVTPRTIWSGNMRAHYSRNWLEQPTPVSGPNLGVWRFLLNGDLRADPFLLNHPASRNPCVLPPCYAVHGRVFFAGYIDYAQDCQTSDWSAAWALNHEKDLIHHAPSSARPAPAVGFHPTRSYTFVGPGAGFVASISSVPRSDGAIVAEAVRWNDWSQAPNICRFEEPVQGVFQAFNELCPCLPPPGGPPQYIETRLAGNGSCGTQFASVAQLNNFLQKRVGFWSVAGTFPGIEFLLLDSGRLSYRNGCTQLTTTEFFEGVETIDGFPAFDYQGNPLPRQFEDLGSANRGPNNPALIVGAPYVSHFILNLNLP